MNDSKAKAVASARPKHCKSSSEELWALLSELDITISMSEMYEKSFRHFMISYCKRNGINIELFLQKHDSPPRANDTIYWVETELPRRGWKDAQIAALLEDATEAIGLGSLYNKFSALRKTLTCTTSAGSEQDADSSDNYDIDRAISLVCHRLGHGWRLFFVPLGLCDSLLDDCDLQKTIPAKCFSAFAKWKEKEGKTATIFRLLQALCESDLIGTAEELIDKLHLSGEKKFKNLLKKYRAESKPQRSRRSPGKARRVNAHQSPASTPPVYRRLSPNQLHSSDLRRSIIEVRTDAKSEDLYLPEEHIKCAESFVPTDKRHIQVIAVGQTGMGKTKSMNRTFGTIAAVARPGQGSETASVSTYTRVLHRGGGVVPFRLSFTDTPGLGDSDSRFLDDEICTAIRNAMRPDATAFFLYFIKAGESRNQRHIAAIKKLEKATGKELTAVVITNAMKMPQYGGECSDNPVDETFRDLYTDLVSAWTSRTRTGPASKKGLVSEYVEYLQQSEDIKYDLTDVSEFGKEPNGDPWSRKTKKLVIQLYSRREIRRGFKAWFRKQLNRPTLRVIKIENDTVEYGDERGKFGLLQFHTNLSLVLHSKTKYASMVFSVMTLEAVRAATKQLELTVIEVGSQPSDIVLEIEAPEDESCKATKDAREESSRGACSTYTQLRIFATKPTIRTRIFKTLFKFIRFNAVFYRIPKSYSYAYLGLGERPLCNEAQNWLQSRWHTLK
ncbi:uncharacterized protein [Oscarella lobularis]|uniref:uncharacterized protein isoform X3 n=1 Tax=Oscarella lobularis TaxID=121494 RepID=UPI003314324F